ncbi:hypothetical protein M404DRAFT_948149 [Pisolithus tinctorius Marx 270]|uniref:Uncharacterized protein n=1 Tax=Pisolithus tinctorius Marx 270 TaxID=870435 RepID=A0A0C3J6S5_PISTI|nr:hypothetical protein M404DRAFT_948149 [Pisolithus tinctorius Marx 270]
MQRLCDEVIALIIYELEDPTALTLTSKRFLHVSRDPYVRAHYFLSRYGHMDAMFWALGKGKILDERVIDILFNSGAHISRYLLQVAIHHFYRGNAPFIKSQWVRSVRPSVFSYFQKVAAEMFDNEVPVGKHEDDGSKFHAFLKDSRLPSHMRQKNWEEIRDIFQRYRFIPFSMKDPLMFQLPIALAVEPRLLPYAEANGFRIDPKYRDFIFRKMFEKQSLSTVDRSEEIVSNVRELKRLDPRMFLSRTVAAEVCMEAKTNESAYRALKTLDRTGDLLFSLRGVCRAVIDVSLSQLFVKSRSIMTGYTTNVLRQLYSDFPSNDLTVRTAMLLTVFLFDGMLQPSSPLTMAKSKLQSLNLLPVTRQDILTILTNPFIEKPIIILDYAREEMDMSPKAIKELVHEVVVTCLGVGSKGKTIRRLTEYYGLKEFVAEAAVQRYTLSIADLPPLEDEQACAAYEAPLCPDYSSTKASRVSSNATHQRSANGSSNTEPLGTDEAPGPSSAAESPRENYDIHMEDAVEDDTTSSTDDVELGAIGQDTLSAMIRQDEMAPIRARRRSYYYNMYNSEVQAKLGYPAEFLQVGRWVKETYPPESPIMAVFFTHAVINNNSTLLHLYLPTPGPNSLAARVPITLKHFKLLAHLGRAPNFCLYHEIELGAEFYFSEEDYLSKQTLVIEPRQHGKHRIRDVKKETSPATVSHSLCQADPSSSTPPRICRKRPRRSTATTATSYIIPDSDDEAIVESDDENAMVALMTMQAKKRKVESNLQRWIKHLSALLAEEQRKYKEKRRRLEKITPPDGKLRVNKSEFHKSLTTHLRSLRKVDLDKRKQLYGPDAPEEDYSDDEDDEYRFQKSRANKRRRSNVAS